jgi:hypothetical protein
MERRQFLQCANLCGVGLLGLGTAASAAAPPCRQAASGEPTPLKLRPYQLLCTICSLGAEQKDTAPQYEKCKALREAMRTNPDMPVTLHCHAGPLYVFQDSGTEDDTPESDEFNRKRDLDVLQMLDLPPGATLPARTIFSALLKGVSTVSGVCGYQSVTSDVWKGCIEAASGNYERGHEKALKETWYSHLSDCLITARTEEEMAREKRKSLQAMYSASVVTIRPHIMVCAVCQYGEGLRPPYKEDNLPELLQLIINEKPDLPIKMAPGADWMICAPCPGRNTKLNCCMHVWGSGELDSQLRDLNLLQKLGLKFGSTMKARELLRLIFERVTTTHGMPDFCLKYNTMPSVWWDECAGHLYGASPHVKYEKGKRELMATLRLVSNA